MPRLQRRSFANAEEVRRFPNGELGVPVPIHGLTGDLGEEPVSESESG